MKKQSSGDITFTYGQIEEAIKKGELDKLLKPVADRLDCDLEKELSKAGKPSAMMNEWLERMKCLKS